MLYLGLISGTSVDGIDAVVASFDDERAELIAHVTVPYTQALCSDLLAAIADPKSCAVDRLGDLDARCGQAFAEAAASVRREAGVDAADIAAVGSHGQTLYHQPDAQPPYSVQIGDPAAIACATGIVTVADFRRQDVALGGQGAPLVPPFHRWLFADDGADVAVANIGGIANLTLLPVQGPVTGFDCGPGNTLMDAWTRKHRGVAFDENGAWAALGNVDDRLLKRLLADPYLEREPPKSTGFEHYNLGWLEAAIPADMNPDDVQATLLEFTARSLSAALLDALPECRRLILCGGGAHNATLVARLRTGLRGIAVESSARHGIGPDWVEAAAFAWLARERLAGRPGNLPEVTGASRPTPLGGVYLPPL